MARKVLSEEEAEAARIEIKRRMLAELGSDGETSQPPGGGPAKLVIILVAVLMPFLVIGLYFELGRPDIALQTLAEDAAAPETGAQFQASQGLQPQAGAQPQNGLDEVSVMIHGLAARLVEQPDDPEGWRMLGWSYLSVGRYEDAADAYARAVEQKDDDPELRSARGEAMVRAAGGMVTDEAMGSFQTALSLNPKDPRARFFVGLSKEQKGDKQAALNDWVAILEDGPTDATWMPDLRKRIADLGEELGLNPADLPSSKPLPSTRVAAAFPGPTAQDIESAQEMAPQDRQAMINAMVERLAQRLEENPEDYEGWLRLARSRTVLGQMEAAQTALRRAAEIFASDPNAQEGIRRSAKDLGLVIDGQD